jgi:DNA-binding HxlR family transcriptional regulator
MNARRIARSWKDGVPVATECPLTAALQVVGGRWSMIALYWLGQGPQRFNGLRRLMPSISHKVLSTTLRDLEREGLVDRTVIPNVPPSVEYAISEYGRSALPLIEAARQWGRRHLERNEN